jgi:polyphosphate kinase
MFLRDAPRFEAMLIEARLRLVKLWLDVSKKEQAKRLKARKDDPLKALKISSLDAVAQEKWDEYTDARDEMLRRTHTSDTPWTIIHTDKKKVARLAIMRHLLRVLAPKDIANSVDPPDPRVLYEFDVDALTDGRLER